MTEAVFAVGDGVFDTPPPPVPCSDPREAPGQECEAGLVAWQARLVHDEWRRACWMLETARARADVLQRWPEPDPRVIAAALGWSVSMAASRLETAQGALERLPRLGVAMRDGWLEHAKVAAFRRRAAGCHRRPSRGGGRRVDRGGAEARGVGADPAGRGGGRGRRPAGGGEPP